MESPERMLLKAIKEGQHTANAIAGFVGINGRGLDKLLRTVKKAGLIEYKKVKDGGKGWQLTSKGVRQLKKPS